MRRIPLRRPTPGLVVGCVALTVALGGTSFAAVSALPRSSVGTVQLKNNAVTTKKLAGSAVTSAKVKNGSLLSSDFKAGQLPAGPTGPQGPPGSPGVNALETVNATSAVNSTTTRTMSMACPSGKRLIGGGARLNGVFPTVAIQRSFADNDNTWTAQAREMTPNAGSWSLTAFAICAVVAS
jgi:hypothetical protein